MNKPNAKANNKQDEIKHVIQHYPDGSLQPRRLVSNPVTQEIPAGIYSLQADGDRGLYLQPEYDYKLPERVYGKTPQHIDRILRSYELNDKNLGALLIGEAGAGKTLMLKEMANKVVELQMPAILVNEPYSGEALVTFMNSITQPALFIFDEVDKTYAERMPNGNMEISRGQNTLLQILDGTSAGAKKLFMFSANEEGLISRYMKDRPSRVRYTIKFDRMDVSTVVDYVSTNLNDKSESHMHAFIHLALSDGTDRDPYTPVAGSRGLNFDMMVELVREMNQFSDDVNQVSSLIRYYGQKTMASYSAEIYQEGKLLQTTVAQGSHEGSYMGVDPCSIIVSVVYDLESEAGSHRELRQVLLSEADFVAFGSENDKLEYSKDGVTYMLRYIPETQLMKINAGLMENMQFEQQQQQQRLNLSHHGFGNKEEDKEPPKPPVCKIATFTAMRSLNGNANNNQLGGHPQPWGTPQLPRNLHALGGGGYSAGFRRNAA